MSKARQTFKAFHARNAGEPVFPFEHYDVGEFDLEIGLPDMVCVGRALQTLYTSDKWNAAGDLTSYYHNHGPNDGEGVLTSQNKVKLYAPKVFFPDLPVTKLPIRWPEEIVLLGQEDGWSAQRRPDAPEAVTGKCSNVALFCSPYGWVSKKDPTRVFLVAIEADSGAVECVVDGPGLRVTEAGIEG